MGLKPSKKGGLLKAAEKRNPGGRRILGVDPGLASTGWGVIDYAGNKLRYIAHGCIETEANRPRAERLFFIYQSFVEVLKEYKPVEAAIENLYFGRNISSAMAVAEARGVLCMALAQADLPVLELTPNAIKKGVVGQSSADKAQVQEMVRFLLGLTEIPRPDHAADALGAAVCAAHTVKFE
ncbi:crossover junction endodeoxyribonuclease RuvC [Spirochaetia bacterium]|nr:crossover junction endodeoxyribonuclease RuvC [Spirochaetia bacterium]